MMPNVYYVQRSIVACASFCSRTPDCHAFTFNDSGAGACDMAKGTGLIAPMAGGAKMRALVRKDVVDNASI